MEKEWQQIQEKQAVMNALFSAWMLEKQKHEMITFADEQGNIVERYPDGTQKIIVYANKT